MPKSMTGFGRGDCIRHNRRFKVEIKAVNHRFSDFTIKGPRFLNALEDQIRRRLVEDITRGKVDVWISFESLTPSDVTIQVNESYADVFMGTLKRICDRYDLGKIPAEIALDLMVKNQDIIIFDKYETTLSTESSRQEIWEHLSEALDMALAHFNQMRVSEGTELGKAMEDKHFQVCELITAIRKRVPLLLEEQATRLKERTRELMQKIGGKPDDSRLLAEIALIADKSDIDEELARLESHLKQFSEIMGEKQAIGRKMEFLVQEMNREANTIGSKSTDLELTKSVVELKSLIEKIREQVQNIE